MENRERDPEPFECPQGRLASQGTFNQETQAHIINKRTFHYANLILNRLMAMVKKNVIIPTSISVSFQTPVMPSPFIMTDFTIL
jgi:hypothetical protein